MDRNRDYWILYTRDASYRVAQDVVDSIKKMIVLGTLKDDGWQLFIDIFGAPCMVRNRDISGMTSSHDDFIKAEWRHDILMTKERDAIYNEIHKDDEEDEDKPEWLRG
jgi:hypothetical protein